MKAYEQFKIYNVIEVIGFLTIHEIEVMENMKSNPKASPLYLVVKGENVNEKMSKVITKSDSNETDEEFISEIKY